MAHVYSMASFLGHEGSETLIDEALRGLLGELKDKENGGWYAGLTSDNEPLPMKQCYAHAFVILAATSGLLAGREGAKELLEDALATYDKYFWKEGGRGFPAIPGIPSLQWRMITGDSMPTCTLWRRFLQRQM